MINRGNRLPARGLAWCVGVAAPLLLGIGIAQADQSVADLQRQLERQIQSISRQMDQQEQQTRREMKASQDARKQELQTLLRQRKQAAAELSRQKDVSSAMQDLLAGLRADGGRLGNQSRAARARWQSRLDWHLERAGLGGMMLIGPDGQVLYSTSSRDLGRDLNRRDNIDSPLATCYRNALRDADVVGYPEGEHAEPAAYVGTPIQVDGESLGCLVTCIGPPELKRAINRVGVRQEDVALRMTDPNSPAADSRIRTEQDGSTKLELQMPLDLPSLNWSMVTRKPLDKSLLGPADGEQARKLRRMLQAQGYEDMMLYSQDGKQVLDLKGTENGSTSSVPYHTAARLDRLVRSAARSRQFGYSTPRDYNPNSRHNTDPVYFAQPMVGPNGELQYVMVLQSGGALNDTARRFLSHMPRGTQVLRPKTSTPMNQMTAPWRGNEIDQLMREMADPNSQPDETTYSSVSGRRTEATVKTTRRSGDRDAMDICLRILDEPSPSKAAVDSHSSNSKSKTAKQKKQHDIQEAQQSQADAVNTDLILKVILILLIVCAILFGGIIIGFYVTGTRPPAAKPEEIDTEQANVRTLYREAGAAFHESNYETALGKYEEIIQLYPKAPQGKKAGVLAAICQANLATYDRRYEDAEVAEQEARELVHKIQSEEETMAYKVWCRSRLEVLRDLQIRRENMQRAHGNKKTNQAPDIFRFDMDPSKHISW
jgi:TolA-binding protein